jgi:hypothetical protein
MYREYVRTRKIASRFQDRDQRNTYDTDQETDDSERPPPQPEPFEHWIGRVDSSGDLQVTLEGITDEVRIITDGFEEFLNNPSSSLAQLDTHLGMVMLLLPQLRQKVRLLMDQQKSTSQEETSAWAN